MQETVIKYENTYRLESKNPFNEHVVTKIVNSEIKKNFNETTRYDSYEAVKICAAMSLNIRNNIYDLEFER